MLYFDPVSELGNLNNTYVLQIFLSNNNLICNDYDMRFR